VAVLAAAAVFGLVQLLTGLFPPHVALLLLVAGPAVAFAIDRGRAGFLNALTDVAAGGRSVRDGAMLPLLSGLAIVLSALGFLEWRDPYYFTQDDNFSMGPVVIAACRGIFDGQLPTWNPFQLLGQPNSVQSIYALTYPLTYAVFALVRALGREALYIEAFVIAHIVGGYLATYWAARALRVRPILAGASSIAFVLSGTALMIARSYATMAPLLLWAPLLIVAAERLRRGRVTWRWAVGTAVVIGLFCHSGNGQMWVYAVMFFGIAIVTYVTAGVIHRGAMLWIAVAALLSIAIAVLLVIPQMWFMQSVVREGGGGHGIAAFLPAMLLPAPLVSADHPEAWGDPARMAPLYYAGTVFMAIALAGLLAMAGILLACRGVGPLVRDNVWLLCGGLALWTAFGPGGPWSAMSVLPVFDKFNGPWKMLLFVQLFTAIAGALMIERMVSSSRWRPGAAAILATLSVVLILYNVTLTRGAFYDYGDDPYPQLPGALTSLLTGDPPATRGRVLPIAPERSQVPDYVRSLMLDFPSYYGIASLDGYDPFVRDTVQFRRAWERLNAQPHDAARAYGVRWLLVHRTATVQPPLRPGRSRRFMEVVSTERQHIAAALRAGATVRLSLPDLTVYELADADPLAFSSSSRRALPLKLGQNGVDVDVRGLERGAHAVVNVLLLPGMEASVEGGRPAAITADAWDRVAVKVPTGTRELRLRYAPPWRRAGSVAFILTLLAALLAVVASRMSR
jgi:hypothetical protein